MALDMNKIKERLAALDNKGSGGNKNFFRPVEGEQTIRIIPTKDNDPFKEFSMHYNVGKSQAFLCPKRNFNEHCPVCEFASELWREGKDGNDEKMMKAAVSLFVKARFFSPVLVRGEEEKGVRWWGYSETVSKWLLKKALNPQYKDFVDPTKGLDIILTYEKEEGKRFPTSLLDTNRLSSFLVEDEKEREELLNSIPEITDLLVRKSTQEVQVLLDNMAFQSATEEEANEANKDVEKYGEKKEETLVEEEKSKSSTKSNKKGDPVDAAFNQLLDKNV